MRAQRARLRGIGAATLLVATGWWAACGDDDGRADRTDEAGPCAWASRADQETQNIAYPDTAATYWGISYDLAEGEAIELSGSFPEARYASFVTYGPIGGSLDVLTDRDIVPDDGSTNPFAPGSNGDDEPHDYTITITDESDPDRPNTLGAAGPGTTNAALPAVVALSPVITTPTPTSSAPASERLGRGGDGAVSGTVVYRVYVPSDTGDPTGGVGLPGATLVSPDGDRDPVPTCPSPGASEAARELVERFGIATNRPVPLQPVFIRPQAASANLFPNPDNVYIATLVAHEPGRIVVLRGKAPTAAIQGGQVRYWSLCTNEFRKPYPVSACVFDSEVALDADGWYRIVISTPEDRPTNATTANGITWLDWGSTDVTNLLLLRHMLASPDFPESTVHLAPGTLAQTHMGDYAPRGTYCTRADLEQNGPTACDPVP